MRTDLWFAQVPPAIETFSQSHVSVPFCNPLRETSQCFKFSGGQQPASPRFRSSPGYHDALGRGGKSGCDVPTDWLGVMPRHLAETYFNARESIKAPTPSAQHCAAHRSGCFCHDPSKLQPECLLGGHLAAHKVPYTRRNFGLIALARSVVHSPSAYGGDGVFTDGAAAHTMHAMVTVWCLFAA